MLFQILDAAKEWVKSHPLSVNPQHLPAPSPFSREEVPKYPAICKFYLQGKCKFGNKCKNSHGQSTTSDGYAVERATKEAMNRTPIQSMSAQLKGKRDKGASPPDFLHDSSSFKQGVKTKKVNSKKVSRELDDEDNDSDAKSGKKLPMRQATDVISRILWDPDLPSEEFTVGYLDRFVGIIEKPFSAFSWEDIASVGMNVLAIPKHRIQYF